MGFRSLTIICSEWNTKIEKNLSVNFISQWKSQCPLNKKLRIYSDYGGDFGFKSYLEHPNITHRDKLARLRSGSNFLRVHRGRRVGLLIEERLCLLWRQDIECEEHFLKDCNFLLNIEPACIPKSPHT